MVGKKASHVGVILSFVIFVTFVIFLFSILSPVIQVDETKRLLPEILEEDIIDFASADLTGSSVRLDDGYNFPDTSFTCFRVNNLIETSQNAIVRNEDNIISSRVIGQDLDVNWDETERFFKIFYSSEFLQGDLTGGACDPLLSSDYTIGLTKTNKQVFLTKINELVDRYENDYIGMKNELNILEGTEFWFGFFENDVQIEIGAPQEKTIPNSIPVYSEEFQIQYVDMEANLKSGFLIIKVW